MVHQPFAHLPQLGVSTISRHVRLAEVWHGPWTEKRSCLAKFLGALAMLGCLTQMECCNPNVEGIIC